MIIKKLKMYNFGVYAGENIFEFIHKEPIVLVGGMNGRGKTTFLEAILLSLYGDNSIAYKESKFRSYNQYLRSYVNKNHWNQSSFVELEFILNESTRDTYQIRREWDALTKITKEKITVWKNGEESDFLTKNWAMFIENILPSALSSFYFFDGEKIAELAVDHTNEQMKNSIRSMLGITILDVLRNDLERSLRRNSKKFTNTKDSELLDKLRQERDQAITELEEIDKRLDNLEHDIERLQSEIETLQNSYDVKGGSALEQKQKLIQKRAGIQADLAQNIESLISVAASELPLIMVKDLLSQIKLQAEDEHNDSIMMQALNQMDYYLSVFAQENQNASESGKKFVEFVKHQTEENEVESILELSDHGLFQASDLVEHGLEDVFNEALREMRKKEILEKQFNEVEGYLSLDINEKELNSIYQRMKRKELKLVEMQVRLKHLQQERSSINSAVITKTAEFNRNVETYLQKLELKDDADRMIKYTNLAIKLVDVYSVELQKRKTGNLGDTITECYKQLANKKNLIQSIVMDPKTLDIRYLDDQGNEVSKESLSAGEKQLMVIAILWALALCSKKKLPVIIDTPLSRLDSQHRAAIVTTYFPNASDQTIILSTDTEIDHTYYDMMKNSIGDEFTLNYSEETKSTSIEKGYFKS